jgi:hypothetical protein
MIVEKWRTGLVPTRSSLIFCRHLFANGCSVLLEDLCNSYLGSPPLPPVKFIELRASGKSSTRIENFRVAYRLC